MSSQHCIFVFVVLGNKIFYRAAQDRISSSIFNHLFYKNCTYKETNHFLRYDGGKYYVLKSYLKISFSSYSIQRILDRYCSSDSMFKLQNRLFYLLYGFLLFYLDFITDNRFIMLNVVLLWLIMTVWQCTNRHLTKDSTLLSERTIDHCVE